LVETINLSVVPNAADQLEQPEQNLEVAANGLHPALKRPPFVRERPYD
jgi:hypothetical protein